MAGHGTRSRYNGGCRCADCTEAHRIWTSNRRAEHREARELVDDRWVVTRPDISHGRHTTYINYSCGCEPCTAAHRRAGKDGPHHA